MVIGILAGLISLWILFGTGPLTKQHLFLAGAVAGTYFVGMLFAPVFPGTEWHDPEFSNLDPMVLGFPAQKLVALIICALLFTACVLSYKLS